jgi:hypothetical protein
MTEKKRDYAFEALAEVTGSDWTANRGELNAALQSIGLQEPLHSPDSMALADEIHKRAKMYRSVYPDLVLTPPALAKHWRRVLEESERQAKPKATNQHSQATKCELCSGDRFVLVATRPAKSTAWMEERKRKPNGEMEEYAPCPDCNSGCDASFRRPDGYLVTPPDPSRVREMMRS